MRGDDQETTKKVAAKAPPDTSRLDDTKPIAILIHGVRRPSQETTGSTVIDPPPPVGLDDELTDTNVMAPPTVAEPTATIQLTVNDLEEPTNVDVRAAIAAPPAPDRAPTASVEVDPDLGAVTFLPTSPAPKAKVEKAPSTRPMIPRMWIAVAVIASIAIMFVIVIIPPDDVVPRKATGPSTPESSPAPVSDPDRPPQTIEVIESPVPEVTAAPAKSPTTKTSVKKPTKVVATTKPATKSARTKAKPSTAQPKYDPDSLFLKKQKSRAQ